MNKITSYLDNLEFDQKLSQGFITKYIGNIRLVALLVISVLLLGITSFISLPRRLNPEVKIPIVAVTTVFPGASPSEIESLVTEPIEDEVDGIDGLDTITSVSQENLSIVTLEFFSNIDGEDAEKDVQSVVDRVQIPDDALNPEVKLFDFEDQPIWTFAVTTDTSDANLFNFSRSLEEEIKKISTVDRVETTGLEHEEIIMNFSKETLQEIGVNPQQLISVIKPSLNSFPAGNVSANGTNISVSIDPVINNIEDIRQTEININGNLYTLGSISEIYLGTQKEKTEAYIASENTTGRTVVFSVYKNINADIIKTSERIKEVVNSEIGSQPNFEVLSIVDSAADINTQFDDLGSNFASTVFLVFVTLFVFLGVRQAVIVSFSIPLTFLISFTIMRASGISLNFLSTFSLLLALGLLVDDAIVIVSAMTQYYKTGKFTSLQTGRIVWKDFIVPIWSTTITTVWAFVPLLLSSGIIGEFIKSIPIVVSSTLLASTSVAVLITLPLMVLVLNLKIANRVKMFFKIFVFAALIIVGGNLIPRSALYLPTMIVYVLFISTTFYLNNRNIFSDIFGKHVGGKIKGTKIHSHGKNIFEGLVNTQRLVGNYQNFIEKILSSKSGVKKTIVGVVIFSVFSYALVPLGFVLNEFFPKTDSEIIYINLELPEGTKNESTVIEGKKLLESVRNTSDIEVASLEMGKNFSDSSSSIGENKALISLNLKEEDERRSSIIIAQELRDKYATYPEGDINVIEISGGPPAGADLQIKYSGENLEQLNSLADQTILYLENLEGTTNVRKSIETGTSKLRFVPYTQVLADKNLTIDQIGFWLRTYVSGLEIEEIEINSEDIDIVMRINESEISPQNLTGLTIPTQNGDLTLEELGYFKLEPNPTIITRENGKRTISVSAGVLTGFNIPQLNQKLETFANTELNLPPGYEWQTGGVNEENQESVQSILLAMLLSAVLIMITMVVQLGSFRKAFIVLLVIPLAVSGVFIIFALTGTPLSFPALIGVLALFGIVVNNSIVLVEKINQNLAIRMQLKDAIVDAAGGRLEPIFFSSLTTITGLLPITISDPLWRGLGGAIISGLVFSGGIMLLFIPACYYLIYRKESEQDLVQ